MREFTVPFEADEPEHCNTCGRTYDTCSQGHSADGEQCVRNQLYDCEQRCERLLEVCQELLEHGYWRDSYEKEAVAKRARAAIAAEHETKIQDS
jgi:hypothetical protein